MSGYFSDKFIAAKGISVTGHLVSRDIEVIDFPVSWASGNRTNIASGWTDADSCHPKPGDRARLTPPRATIPKDTSPTRLNAARINDHPFGGLLSPPAGIVPPGVDSAVSVPERSQDTFGKMGTLPVSSELGSSPGCPRLNDLGAGRPVGPAQFLPYTLENEGDPESGFRSTNMATAAFIEESNQILAERGSPYRWRPAGFRAWCPKPPGTGFCPSCPDRPACLRRLSEEEGGPR